MEAGGSISFLPHNDGAFPTSIKINGKEYKVACNKSEVDELMLSAKMLI